MTTDILPRPKVQLAQALLPRSTPRAAFGQTVRNEARLAWRQPAGLIFGVGVPLLLLIIFGELPSFHQPQASLGGLALFSVYVPIIITFVIAILGLIALPAPLVSHRDLGILRRLSTTPMPPSWVLAAQLVVQACIVGLIAGIGILIAGFAQVPGSGSVILIAVGVLLIIASQVGMRGLTAVVAGEARVVQLFGRYRGTIRTAGLQWVNPVAQRRKVSARIRNLETAMVKVNDADGNPLEIAAVVVWLVQDTAKAIYAVDDFEKFVAIQSETAVRHIASSYAYETQDADTLSLQANADEITTRLSAEIALRVASAGVQIVESRLTRLTRLSYAAEIVQAMLRRQAASAVVGARQRIVEGAVGMVKLALTQLEEQGVVELDEERKAAMVSNLLVVLCSEQATQQVVNTGSLYQ